MGNDRILHVQQLLYGRDDLMADGFMRWGVMRPTVRHPEWKTDASWLHWDWAKTAFAHIQSFACLTDNTLTSGGLACVPGFHTQRWQQWGQAHPEGSVTTADGRVLDRTFGSSRAAVPGASTQHLHLNFVLQSLLD